MAPIATQQNARNVKPEILRNEIVENVDQIERVQAGGDGQYASAMSLFPLVNIDDPDEEWYTMDGVRSPMQAVSFSSESPLGTLDLPDKDSLSVQSYKKKYRPDKGAEEELGSTPFSVYQRAASVLRTEIFLTREQVTWRGDNHIDGLIGQFGGDPHDDISADGFVNSPTTSWDDAVNAEPYDDITEAAYEVLNNGRMFGGNQAEPTMLVTPSVNRDLKQTDDMHDRIINTRIGAVGDDDLMDLIDDDISSMQKVLVYLPRKDANGNYIDDAGNIVDDPDDAEQDNVLEPYDPGLGRQVRHVIFMRPGAGTAYVPWFLDRLLERSSSAPDPGTVSVDENNGFFTQVWNESDPLMTNFKAAQEIGFHVQRGENIAILSDV